MQPSMEVHAHAHLSHPAVPHGDGGLGLVGQNSRAPKDKVATGPSMDSGEKSKERENLIKSVAKHNGSDDDTAKSLLGVSCNDINSSGVKKKRTLSPSIVSAKPQISPKKLKADRHKPPTEEPTPPIQCGATSLSQWQEIPETKLDRPPPTPGGNLNIRGDLKTNATQQTSTQLINHAFEEPSCDPQPSFNENKNMHRNRLNPPWGQQVIPILKAMVKELSHLKTEVKELRRILSSHNANRDSMDMDWDIQDHGLEKTPERSSPISKKPKHSQQTVPPHAEWLNGCFYDRIGLSPQDRAEVDILSFDGVLVARGYNRILPTWQGFFVELEKNDVMWKYLTRDEWPPDGKECYRTRGVQVFRLTRPDHRRTPLAHRFALKTPSDFTGRCNPLLADKWYIHAYQVRFIAGNRERSLNSRVMATALKRKYPDKYHPRGKDLPDLNQDSNERPAQPIQQAPARNFRPAPTEVPKNYIPLPKPTFTPTPFIPLPTFNQTCLPHGTHIPTSYSHPPPILSHPWQPGIATQQQLWTPNPHWQTPIIPHQRAHWPQFSHFPPQTQGCFPATQQNSKPSYAQVANRQNQKAGS